MSDQASLLDADGLKLALHHFGWEREVDSHGSYELWSRANSRTSALEIIVPSDPSKGDYAALLVRAARQLSHAQGSSLGVFIQDLSTRQSSILDSTRWKRETAVPAGLIAWGEGLSLYKSAEQQLIAAAKAARAPRKIHGSASAFVAKRFLEQSFMGQTEVGSFIITALTPAQAKFHVSKRSEISRATSPRNVETISGRTVIETFTAALEAVRSGLDEFARGPRLEIFEERIEAGVSYEFLRSLAIFTTGAESAVQIETAGGPNGRSGQTEFDFTPPEARIIERASTAFAQDDDPRDATVIGEVTFLKREHDNGDRVVRLDIVTEDGPRKVRVRLDPEQYEYALQAHSDESLLQVKGRLEREGKLLWMYSPQSLARVEQDDLASDEAIEHFDDPLFELEL